jgi:hypothetical protein
VQNARLLIVSSEIGFGRTTALATSLKQRAIRAAVILIVDPWSFNSLAFLDIAEVLSAAAVVRRPFSLAAIRSIAAELLQEASPAAGAPGDMLGLAELSSPVFDATPESTSADLLAAWRALGPPRD